MNAIDSGEFPSLAAGSEKDRESTGKTNPEIFLRGSLVAMLRRSNRIIAVVMAVSVMSLALSTLLVVWHTTTMKAWRETNRSYLLEIRNDVKKCR